MKRMILLAILLFLVVSPSSAQHWEWEWVDLQPNGSVVDSMLGQAVDCVTLEGESSPRFFVSDESQRFTMIYDIDPDPDHHAWTTQDLDFDLPDGVTLSSSRFIPEGSSFVRMGVHVQGQPDTLMTYRLDITNELAQPVPDRSFIRTGETDGFFAIGDFDGNGLFDYAVLGGFQEYSLTVYLQGDTPDTLTVLLQGGTVPAWIYALDIDEDGQDEIFLQRITFPMHSPTSHYNACVLAATPDSTILEHLESASDRVLQLFVADIDGDGSDEFLSNDWQMLLEGTIDNEDTPLHFTPVRAWSPPYRLWMPLEFGEEGSVVRFLSGSAPDLINHVHEDQSSVNEPYLMWTVDPNGESYSLFGTPFYWRGGTASFHAIDEAGTEALFLAGAHRYGEYAYEYSTEAWLPPASENDDWQHLDQYDFATDNLEYTDPVGVGDFDGDGQLELVSLYWVTELRLYELEGDNWEHTQTWPYPENAPALGITWW